MARVAIPFLAVLATSNAALLSSRISNGECSDVVLEESDFTTFFPTAKQISDDNIDSQLFSVSYGTTFKVLTSHLAQEQYILTQCGQSTPDTAEIDAVKTLASGYVRKHFTIPLESAAALSTTLMAFFDKLGVQDRVSYVDAYSCGACWLKALGCGAKLESSYGDASVRSEQINSVDAVFMDCGVNNDCSAVNAQSNAVHVPVTQDAGPLESAEYIKYIGAFFNLEPEAKELFSSTSTEYNKAAENAPSSPLVVAWINYNAASSWSEESFVVSQATYKTTMVSDVGATNFDAATSMANLSGLEISDAVSGLPAAGKTYTVVVNESTAETSAAFFEALSDVDVVVDEFYAPVPSAYNFATFLETYGLTTSSSLKFIQNKMVLRIDRTLSTSNGLDWYESRVANPEWALEGLANVLYSDASKRQKYFRNIATGEMPDQVLSSSSCAITLPVCDANAEPATIEMLEAVQPVTTTTTTQPPEEHSGALAVKSVVGLTSAFVAAVTLN